MVADFDSVRQGDLWQRVGAVEADRRLRAILRLACLLEGRLILTDSQLLDGIYFLTNGPDDVAALLGCDPWRIPLTISVEAKFASLEESRRCKAADRDFEWSSRAVVATGPKHMYRQTLDQHELRRMDWLAAVNSGRVEQTRFERFGPEVFEKHWRAAHPMLSAGKEDVLPASLEEMGLGGCTVRSLAREVIIDQFGALSEPAAQGVYSRWDAAYQTALAESNDASWMSFSGNGGSAAVSPVLRGSVKLDGTLLDEFADIEGPVYALASHRARSAVKTWRESPTSKAIHEISYAVTQTLEPAASRRVVFRGALLRLLATVFLSLAVLLLTVGGSRSAGVALLTAALAFVAAIPWSEFSTTLSARKGRLQAVIRVEPQ